MHNPEFSRALSVVDIHCGTLGCPCVERVDKFSVDRNSEWSVRFHRCAILTSREAALVPPYSNF